jgi:hypothetical protein
MPTRESGAVTGHAKIMVSCRPAALVGPGSRSRTAPGSGAVARGQAAIQIATWTARQPSSADRGQTPNREELR